MDALPYVVGGKRGCQPGHESRTGVPGQLVHHQVDAKAQQREYHKHSRIVGCQRTHKRLQEQPQGCVGVTETVKVEWGTVGVENVGCVVEG